MLSQPRGAKVIQRKCFSRGRIFVELCVHKVFVTFYLANVAVDILLEWDKRGVESKLGACYVENVLLTVVHRDLQDFVLVHD